MKGQSPFNVFYQFAGCFVPQGLLSLKKLSPGAKLCYAALAQQANSRGITQLNLLMLAESLGASEGNMVRYLVELEECGLVEASRGNVNKEDVRISFPTHPWLTRHGESARDPSAYRSATFANETQPRLFAVESASSQGAKEQSHTDNRSAQPSRPRRRKRWFGRPRSRHSFETCLSFITYQKEVLGRRGIYDPQGLAESIYYTGKQDEEVDDYLAEQSSAA
jgi:hypothetical protein